MLRKLLCACCVLGLVAPAVANDTLIMLPEGEEANTATGNATVFAMWNGASYDSINVISWFRDLGDTSTNEAWRGYQIAYDDAIPTPGCAGNVIKSVGTMQIDDSRSDWIHFGGGPGFQTITDAAGVPSVALSSLMMCPCPGLDDSAKYLCEMAYDITAGTAGTWIVRPRCLNSDNCPEARFCTKSFTSCTIDDDCPRYAILGDATDTCVVGISPDADTFLQDEFIGRAPHDVFQLEIEVRIGQCCDGVTCLGELTEEDCYAVPGAVWTYGKTCADDCICLSHEDCDDGDACTDNVCGLDGQCTYPLSYDPATGCCDSATGTVLTIDDGNACTVDTCNANGSVTYTNVAWGTETQQCLDEAGEGFIDNGCTLNICNGMGGCEVFNIDGTACDDAVYTDGACLSPTYGIGGECDVPSNTCMCTSVPSLLVDYTGGKPEDPSCFGADDEVLVTVSMTNSAIEILAAHVNVEYDPTCLQFVSIETAGAVLDEWTPNYHPPLVVEQYGEITFEVFGGWSQPPATTPGPEDLVLITFNRLPGCTGCEVCVVEGVNPGHTYLADGYWEPIVPDLSVPCSPPIHSNGYIELTVPDDIGGNLLCDEAVAMYTWDEPTATHPCAVPDISCTCASFDTPRPDFDQADCDALAMTGGMFPPGTFVFECGATVDFCGHSPLIDTWTVVVSDLTTVVAEVELQPLMNPDEPFTRCIVFELFPSCLEERQVVLVDMEFGDWDSPVGHGTVEFKTAGRLNYDCVTARDPYHTLRSVVQRNDVNPLNGPLYCADGKLHATFKSTHSENYWLIGGNLDGNDRIDIIDFGMLAYQYNVPLMPIDDYCGVSLGDLYSWDGYPDADINSDGLVDLNDFSFVATNYLMMSKDACCPDQVASDTTPITSISIAQLELMGLGHLSIADRNDDGMLDTEDMVAMMNGNVPQRQVSPKVRSQTRIRTSR